MILHFAAVTVLTGGLLVASRYRAAPVDSTERRHISRATGNRLLASAIGRTTYGPAKDRE